MIRGIIGGALVALVATTVQATSSGEVVLRWNRVMLEAIEQNPPRPTVVCRQMFIVSSAMYDAWCAYDNRALATTWFGDDLRRPASERTVANQKAAVSYAAHRALVSQFPNQKPLFDAVLADLGYAPSNSLPPTTPDGIGNLCCDSVLAARANDGSNAANNYVDATSATFPRLYKPVNVANPESRKAPGGSRFDANRWQPLRIPNGTLLDGNGVPIFDNDDPSTYVDQGCLTPHWGAVTPFALERGDQLRPAPPPQFGSNELYTDGRGRRMTNDEAWHDQVNEILEISAELTDRQKVIAEFWADGPHTWTPPGHWNQIAHGIAIRDGHNLADNVRMFFALNGALLDASIACWESKRAYDLIRPASAIRHIYFDQMIEAWGGPNQGTQTILGQDWQPYQAATFVTPAFQEYVSGHSTFSRASREVLKASSGSDRLYDGQTRLGEDFDGDGVEDLLGQHIALPGSNTFEDSPSSTVVLRWPTMLDAAIEAGMSRRFGGIHIQDGDLRARDLGKKVGLIAFAHAQALWDPIEGDVNRDGRLNQRDLNLVVSDFGSTERRSDLDDNGVVDVIDIVLIASLVN